MRTKTKNDILAVTAPYVEIINQVGGTFLSPVWSVKEIIRTAYSSQKQINFQEFVAGIAYYFANASMDFQDVKTLVKKVSDSDNYETMTNILDSVFFSHSNICRAILGIITGKFMRDDTLDYEDMVLVSALKDLFDEDLTQFWQYFNCKPKDANDRTSFIDHFSETDRLIVEKLQNAGVLGRDLAGNRFGSSLRFEITIVSKRLHGYLKALQPMFIDQLNEVYE